MRLTFDALIVLDAIDRGGSFSAAAEALHRVPSAITYTVQKLEDDLGVQLFDRSGIPYLETTDTSIEEIASRVLERLAIPRRVRP